MSDARPARRDIGRRGAAPRGRSFLWRLIRCSEQVTELAGGDTRSAANRSERSGGQLRPQRSPCRELAGERGALSLSVFA
jgi:hypothetical protein